MKFIFTALVFIICCEKTWANCNEAYQQAAKKRDIRNEVVAVAAGITAMAVAPSLFPTATIYFVGKYTLTVIGVVSVTELKRSGVKIYKNNFEKMLAAFEAAENKSENRFLNRIIKKSIARAGLEKSPENIEHAREIIVDAFENNTLCPLTGQDRHGRQKQSVFNRSALIDFVSIKLNDHGE